MRFIAGVVTTLVVLALAGLAVLYSGVYDVAASSGHGPAMKWLLHTGMRQSVLARTPSGTDASPPSQERVTEGAKEFGEHCVGCHGAPGKPAGRMAKGMTPEPPDLKEAAEEWNPAQLRWIVLHGVKMTAMPAWQDILKPEEVDGVVAFLRVLPHVSAEEYQRMAGGGGEAHEGEHTGS